MGWFRHVHLAGLRPQAIYWEPPPFSPLASTDETAKGISRSLWSGGGFVPPPLVEEPEADPEDADAAKPRRGKRLLSACSSGEDDSATRPERST